MKAHRYAGKAKVLWPRFVRSVTKLCYQTKNKDKDRLLFVVLILVADRLGKDKITLQRSHFYVKYQTFLSRFNFRRRKR